MNIFLPTWRSSPIVLLLCLAGCESMHYTTFAPVAPRIELFEGGGANRFILVNSSGMDLRDVTVWASIWNDRDRRRTSLPTRRLVGECSASLPLLRSGQTLRFYERGNPYQEAVLRDRLSWTDGTRVEIVGKCDQGQFRQRFVMTQSGELQLVSLARTGQK